MELFTCNFFYRVTDDGIILIFFRTTRITREKPMLPLPPQSWTLSPGSDALLGGSGIDWPKWWKHSWLFYWPWIIDNWRCGCRVQVFGCCRALSSTFWVRMCRLLCRMVHPCRHLEVGNLTSMASFKSLWLKTWAWSESWPSQGRSTWTCTAQR